MPQKHLNIADFLGPRCAWGGGRELDYRKLLALSEEDFNLLYLIRMEEFRDKDGLWNEGPSKPAWKIGIPKCEGCHKDISSPAELRHYLGLFMHGSCFREFYRKERDDEPDELKRRYWDRVASLPDVLTQS